MVKCYRLTNQYYFGERNYNILFLEKETSRKIDKGDAPWSSEQEIIYYEGFLMCWEVKKLFDQEYSIPVFRKVTFNHRTLNNCYEQKDIKFDKETVMRNLLEDTVIDLSIARSSNLD